MKLRPIELHVDKSLEAYSSDDCQMLLKIYDDFYKTIDYKLPWIGYFVMSDDKIVGSCGFTGKPTNGRVEIAYWTFKEFEGQGIASYSCKSLVEIAQKTDPAIIVTAKTEPKNNASTKILTNNGFRFSEIVQDHEIGDAWLWILDS